MTTLMESVTWVIVAILIATSLILITPSAAAPAMTSVFPLTCSTATFNANGAAAGEAWFEWGQHSGGPYYWTTPNQTIGAGAFSDYQYGPPMLTGTTYYVRACDTTGCGADMAFAVPAGTRINQTRFGTDVIQIMRSGVNLTQIAGVIIKPFAAPFPSATAFAIPYGLIFFFIFSGMWLRGKDMLIPMFLAMISGGAIWLGGGALGIPPDFITYVGQPLMYIGVAGVIFSWFTK